ncbi:MAG TPA: hypothetical protein VFQ39_02315 [Longimicrobium sp.]|nr:hypothetical protein [Longimicrobium sp.]
MRKLRLEMGELEVQTFEVSGQEGAAGTVMGAERTLNCQTYEFPGCEDYTNGPGTCPADSCDNCYTWECATIHMSERWIDGGCLCY